MAKVHEKNKGYFDKYPYDNILKGQLDFVLDIIQNMVPIREKFSIHPNMFISNKKAVQWANSLPEHIKIDGKWAGDLLLNEINTINNLRTHEITQLYDEISAELSVQPPNKIDKAFDDAYKQWFKNRPSKSHAKLISLRLPNMKCVYEVLHYRFKTRMIEMQKLEKTINENVMQSLSKFERMALTNNHDYVMVCV